MFTNLLSGISVRSAKAYKNIIGLFAVKGVNIAIGFVLVPLTLNYLDPSRYGIWIALSAIFNWFSLFDIGLGNGLRNRLAEALSQNDFLKARIYISTTYAALAGVFLGIFILFWGANFFIDWSSTLNAPRSYANELNLLAGIIFFFFCVRFVTQLILTVALAKQEPAFSQSLDLGGRIVSLVGIYLLTIYTQGSLLYLGISLSALPVITNIVTSIIVFNTRYKDLRPSISLVKFKELKHILSLGVKFFVIQIAVVVLYQTDIIIISRLLGPAEVTPYSIAFQYFSIATLVYVTILTPYWSAFTEAYIKGDVEWIKKVIGNLKLIWMGLVVLVTAFYLSADFLIHLWVGDKVRVDKPFYLVMAVYVLINAYNAIYSQFMNGVGKVMVQFYVAATLAILQIPFAIFACKYFGVKGIMFPAIFFGLLTVLIYNFQYRAILNGTAKGIWYR